MILRAGKRSHLDSKGFTFIELVLVAVIILVLVGITLPQFRRPFSNIQLKNTAQDLVRLMRYLQAKSIAERIICRLNLDFENGTFWPTAQAHAAPGEFVRLEEKWGRTFKVPEGISISLEGEASFITFYPDGSSDKVKLTIAESQGKTYTITTQNKIGYVKVEE